MKTRSILGMLAALLAFTLVAAACGDDGGSADGDDVAADDDSTDGNGETEGGDDDEGSAEGGDDDATTTTRATDVEEAMDPVTGGELVYGLSSDGTGFDKNKAMHPGSIRILLGAVEPLAAVGTDGNWVPALAKDFVANDDFTVWTIQLREGVTFSTGEPFDADTVKANLDAFKASPEVGFVLTNIAEVRVIDPLTVEVEMSAPWGAFPHTLVGQPGWMVRPDTIGQNDQLIGTGAFVLDRWTPGDGATFSRNENYWRDELPYLDTLTFKAIPEQAGRRAALESADIDAFVSPAENDIVEWLDDDAVNVFVSSSNTNEGLVVLNTTKPPTDDIRIRRALAHAVDQQLIVDTFSAGLTIPATSFLDPEDPFYAPSNYPSYDPEEAARLVAEYEAEFGETTLTFTAHDVASLREPAELVADFWKDAGLDVEIENTTQGAEVPTVIADDFNAITWVQFSAADPDGEYVFMHSSGGALNWSNLVDEQLDAGFDQGRQNEDFETRAEGYALVQQRLGELVPFVWWDHLTGTEGVAAAPHVHDVTRNFTEDGEQILGLTAGSFHGYGQIWVDE